MRPFNEAVNLQPHHLRLRAAFGLFLQKHNHFSAAMMQYASILYRDPNNADALQQLNALRIITGEHPVDGLLMPALAVYLGENNDIEFPENWRLLPGAVLKDIREVTVMPSGHLSIVHTRDIWIQNPLMAQKYSQVRIPFYVQYPPKVEFAELILPNGDKKSIGGEQWRVENPNRNTTLFGDSRNLVLLCEGLEAGSILAGIESKRLHHHDQGTRLVGQLCPRERGANSARRIFSFSRSWRNRVCLSRWLRRTHANAAKRKDLEALVSA